MSLFKLAFDETRAPGPAVAYIRGYPVGDAFGPAARLSGQREDVMLKARHDFKSGSRVGSGVASMAEVTFGLSDADMQALAHYMASRH